MLAHMSYIQDVLFIHLYYQIMLADISYIQDV